MIIFPAVDLYEGKVVRLKQGDFNQETVYSLDPPAKALEWEKEGASWLHVVDLEGAKTGEIKNFKSLQNIRRKVKCRIEFGGGMRSLEGIEKVIGEGIDRVVVGTKALDEVFLSQVLKRFAGKIAVGLDVRSGKVQMQGWTQEGGKTLEEAVLWLNNFPVETLIYTDISKDGMLAGPNFEGLKRLLEKSRSNLILSGGVGKLEDVKTAAKISHPRFEGVIIGKALYDGALSLREALAAAKGRKS